MMSLFPDLERVKILFKIMPGLVCINYRGSSENGASQHNYIQHNNTQYNGIVLNDSWQMLDYNC